MSTTFDTFRNNVIFNTNYYAAIAANWFACGKVNRARSMLRLQIVLDISRTIYVRITHDADCHRQNDIHRKKHYKRSNKMSFKFDVYVLH